MCDAELTHALLVPNPERQVAAQTGPAQRALEGRLGAACRHSALIPETVRICSPYISLGYSVRRTRQKCRDNCPGEFRLGSCGGDLERPSHQRLNTETKRGITGRRSRAAPVPLDPATAYPMSCNPSAARGIVAARPSEDQAPRGNASTPF